MELSRVKKGFSTPRILAYSGVLVALIGVQIFLFSTRSDVETLILRTPGMLYQETEDGKISNLYNYQIINKQSEPLSLTFKIMDAEGTIRLVGDAPTVKGNATTEGVLFIDLPREVLNGRKNKVQVGVYSGEQLIETVKTNFFGPVN